MDLQVDTDALRAGGTAMTQVAERLAQAWAEFSGTAQAMGDIFGDDDVGGLIGMSYQVAQQIAEAAFRSAADGMGLLGDALAGAADRHDANEQQITGTFQKITW